jgi:hypothetical protein
MHKISWENWISLSESFQNLPFYFVIVLGIYEITLILKIICVPTHMNSW